MGHFYMSSRFNSITCQFIIWAAIAQNAKITSAKSLIKKKAAQARKKWAFIFVCVRVVFNIVRMAVIFIILVYTCHSIIDLRLLTMWRKPWFFLFSQMGLYYYCSAAYFDFIPFLSATSTTIFLSPRPHFVGRSEAG